MGGAAIIATSLRNLTWLKISIAFWDSAGNRVGIEGALTIAKNLHKVQHLDIGSNKIGGEAVWELTRRLVHLVHL